METSNQTIGKNLCALRDKMGMSQEALAKMIGVKREMISYYETGAREIPMDLLETLADFFGIDLVDFMDESQEISNANIAFAFRAEDLNKEDFNGIAHFGMIVKNYLKLVALTKE